MKKFIFSIVLLNVCAAYPFIIKDHTQTGATIAGVTLRSPKENGSVSAQLYGNLFRWSTHSSLSERSFNFSGEKNIHGFRYT